MPPTGRARAARPRDSLIPRLLHQQGVHAAAVGAHHLEFESADVDALAALGPPPPPYSSTTMAMWLRLARNSRSSTLRRLDSGTNTAGRSISRTSNSSS